MCHKYGKLLYVAGRNSQVQIAKKALFEAMGDLGKYSMAFFLMKLVLSNGS
jgi:hypothetical protein